MTVVIIFASGLVAFLLWKFERKISRSSSLLSSIAGPEREHWLKGKYTCLYSGASRTPGVHREPSSNSPGWVRVQSVAHPEIRRRGEDSYLVGSESFCSFGSYCGLNVIALQDQQLYVSDPLALHHIVVKEQHIYTETDMFIMCVYCRQVGCQLELLCIGETRSFSAKDSFQPLVRFFLPPLNEMIATQPFMKANSTESSARYSILSSRWPICGSSCPSFNP